ncbi:MAG: PhoU domain-containing protein [Candidatus Nitrosopolaris sp.]
MAKLSEQSVFTSIEAYDNGMNHKRQIFDWSASSITGRNIGFCHRIDCTFPACSSRSAVYSFLYGRSIWLFEVWTVTCDIVDVLETIGPIPACDKTAVLEMGKIVREMILLSVHSLETRDKTATSKLYQLDDTVDALYRKYLREAITQQQNGKNANYTDPRCYILALLILRYLERISDHPCYAM